jgi:hypothetical protein
MDDRIEDVLRRVASGDLTPQEAEPLIAALSGERRPGTSSAGGPRAADSPTPTEGGAGSTGRAVRVQVTEGGRTVVNLRIPMSWTGLATLVPGLSSTQVGRVAEALRNGERGRIVDIQDADGDGVIISTE